MSHSRLLALNYRCDHHIDLSVLVLYTSLLVFLFLFLNFQGNDLLFTILFLMFRFILHACIHMVPLNYLLLFLTRLHFWFRLLFCLPFYLLFYHIFCLLFCLLFCHLVCLLFCHLFCLIFLLLRLLWVTGTISSAYQHIVIFLLSPLLHLLFILVLLPLIFMLLCHKFSLNNYCLRIFSLLILWRGVFALTLLWILNNVWMLALNIELRGLTLLLFLILILISLNLALVNNIHNSLPLFDNISKYLLRHKFTPAQQNFHTKIKIKITSSWTPKTHSLISHH